MSVTTKNNYTLGILFKILNGLLFVVMSILMSETALTLPTIQVLFIRVTLCAILCAFCLKIMNQPISFYLPKEKLILYLGRAITNFFGMVTWIEALRHLGISEATALMYTAPVWTILMARIFFKEQGGLAYFLVIACNIIGVLIILSPSSANFSWIGVGAALVSTLIWSGHSMICKKQSATEHYMLQTFYTFVLSIVVMAPFALMVWKPVPQEMLSGLITSSAAVAVIGVVNVSVLFLAYVYAPVIVIEPFSYVKLIFASVLSYFVYQMPLTMEFLAGSLIILAANFYFFTVKERITLTPKKKSLPQETT